MDLTHLIYGQGVPSNYPHEWAYSGACLDWISARSVSVGIYRVVRKTRGKGLKRGKTVKRIRGASAAEVCRAAERWIVDQTKGEAVARREE